MWDVAVSHHRLLVLGGLKNSEHDGAQGLQRCVRVQKTSKISHVHDAGQLIAWGEGGGAASGPGGRASPGAVERNMSSLEKTSSIQVLKVTLAWIAAS